jgi:hypothetical protein
MQHPGVTSTSFSRRFRVEVIVASILLISLGCEKVHRPDNPDAATSPPVEGEQSFTAGQHRMLELLAHIKENSGDNPFLGDHQAVAFRRKLAAVSESDVRKRFDLLYLLGLAELELGNERVGVEHLSEAFKILPEQRVQERGLTAYQLAVAYMRFGESQNCCLHNTPESCILPIRGRAVHTEPEGSEQAVHYFLEALKHIPENGDLHFAARWLLNIAYMTLGAYPDKVPKKYLIPPTRFESKLKFSRFKNVASSLGLDTFNLSGGAIIDDFDNDDDLDLITSTIDVSGPMHYFSNNGTFADRTEQAGLLGLYGGLNLVQADYDNDGHLDVFVLRGAWWDKAGRHPNSLLRNNGNARFTDVTFEAGLGDMHYPTQTAAWSDYDNDGDLDLFIGNESSPSLEAKCQLFRNNGDGTFTDVASRAGVAYRGYPKGVVWGDYDRDGFPDLYISEFWGPNLLYHNNGDGTFSNVALRLGVDRPNRSFPVWFWDFDNDGVLDIFVSSDDAYVAQVGAHYAGYPRAFEGPRLYRGNGRGGFEDVAEQQNLVLPSLPMGANFGDLDNDGYLDFYLGTGDPSYDSVVPNLMFLNRQAHGFVNVTMAGGFGHLQKGHAIAFADLDSDGDLDVFVQMGGSFPGDEFHDALFENPGFGNHSLTVQLVGVRSNRSAIGARLRARFRERDRERSVYREVSSGGSFGANPLRQTIGLGTATRVDELEVVWPTTGLTQRFQNLNAGQTIRITEGQSDYDQLRIESVRFRL